MADDITKLFELTKTGGKGSAVLDWKPSPEVEEFMERIKDYALTESGVTEEGGEGIGSLLAAAKAIDKIGKGKSVKTPKFSFTDDDLTRLILGEDELGFDTTIEEPFGWEDANIRASARTNRDTGDYDASARLNLAFHGGGTVQVEEEEFSSPEPIDVPLSEVQPVAPVDDTRPLPPDRVKGFPPDRGKDFGYNPFAGGGKMGGYPQVLPYNPMPMPPRSIPYTSNDNPGQSLPTNQYLSNENSPLHALYLKHEEERAAAWEELSVEDRAGYYPMTRPPKNLAEADPARSFMPWNQSIHAPRLPGGCFVKGSEILLEDHTVKKVEDVEEGDQVHGSGKEINTVQSLLSTITGGRKLVAINEGDYFTTEDHPFMSVDGSWKSCNSKMSQEKYPELNVKQLKVGDKIRGHLFDETEVESINFKEVPFDTELYNFELDNDHTYIVNNYLMHNKRFGPPRPWWSGAWQPGRPIQRAEGGLIDQLQRPEIYGRGDDTMMMHVTPDEVRGLMSLFPGAITQNPYTGYPEAGGLGDAFKKILPVLAIAAITYFTMGTGTGPALAATGGVGGAGAAGMGGAGAAGMAAIQSGGMATTAGGLGVGMGTAAYTGAAAIPAAAGVGGGLSYGMGSQALAASGAQTGSLAGLTSTPLMHSYAAPQTGGIAATGFSGSSPAALQASMAGAETVPTAYGTYGPTTSKGFATNEAAVKAAKGPDYGDAIRRLANQANQQEEEQPPPQTPMSVEPLQRKDTGLDEIIAASAEELQSPQTPGVETSGLGLDDPSLGLGDVSDEELEEAIIGYRRGGKVDHGGMLVGPSSTLTTGGGLVVGGKMNKDGTFPVDGVHTQIHDGRGKAVQEARLNNGEVVISGGGVAGLGKLMGAPPHKETEAGADYLMQLQRKAESMNKGGTHLSPTNMRPSYGFGLS